MQLTLELKKAIENNAFCSIATYLENNEIQNHLMWIDYKDDLQGASFVIRNPQATATCGCGSSFAYG